jgi:hypothetical protein
MHLWVVEAKIIHDKSSNWMPVLGFNHPEEDIPINGVYFSREIARKACKLMEETSTYNKLCDMKLVKYRVKKFVRE